MAKAKAKDEAGEPISDMEAVRRAIRELGYDAKTQEVHDHILKANGRNLNNNKISAYKSTLRRQAGLARPRSGRGGGRAAAHASVLRVEDVQAVKELVGRLGAAKVRELIDVFH
jgi:hypothetical protein